MELDLRRAVSYTLSYTLQSGSVSLWQAFLTGSSFDWIIFGVLFIASKV